MSRLAMKLLVIASIGIMILLNGCASSGLAEKQDSEISKASPTETIPEESVEELEPLVTSGLSDPLEEQSPMTTNSEVDTSETKGEYTEAIKGTPVIDGTMDAIWEKANIVNTKTVINPDSATAKIRTMWDTDYLYVYAEITDSVLSAVNINAWEQDCFEVFIDQNYGRTLYYEEDDAQYRINFENVLSGGGRVELTLFKSAVTVVQGGYVVEAAIPFSIVKGNANNLIGVDFLVNDDNGSGVRTGQSHWNDTTNAAWQSTDVYGTIKLIDEN